VNTLHGEKEKDKPALGKEEFNRRLTQILTDQMKLGIDLILLLLIRIYRRKPAANPSALEGC